MDELTPRKWDFPIAQIVKNLPANAGDPGSIPGSVRSPGEGKWPPTPVFLSGESHGQRSPAGCSPWGCKELDTTKQLTHTQSPGRWSPERRNLARVTQHKPVLQGESELELALAIPFTVVQTRASQPQLWPQTQRKGLH